MPKCIYPMCMSAARRPEGIESLGTGVTDGSKLQCKYWELNLANAAKALNH